MFKKGCLFLLGGSGLCFVLLICLIAFSSWYATTPEGIAAIATNEAEDEASEASPTEQADTSDERESDVESDIGPASTHTPEPVPTPSQELITPTLNAIPTTAEVASTPTQEPVVAMPPLDRLTQAVREETGDPEPIIFMSEDGYLAVTYRIPENFQSSLAGTFRTQLRPVMARIATISPELEYVELSVIAYGVVGTNPDAVVGFAAYDKQTVESHDWINLTNDGAMALALRSNINDNLE